MFGLYNYFVNISFDIIYGYIQIKCANPNCNKIFKLSRNYYKEGNFYCCNMSCSYGAINIINDLMK